MKLWRMQELTYKTVREQRYEVAVLPVGSTEAHGLHLPYGSDTFHTTALADQVCAASWDAGARVALLPALQYGVQSNALGFPLTINVHQSTLDAIVSDIVESLEHHGIRKIVIFNGHGGNEFRPLLRRFYSRTRLFTCLVDWWKVGSDLMQGIFERPGEHADEMETSVGLALFGDLVRLPDAGDGSTNPSRFAAVNQGWVSIARPWHLLTKDSTFGDPRLAAKEKGEEFCRLVVDRLSAFIVELSSAQMDERFPY